MTHALTGAKAIVEKHGHALSSVLPRLMPEEAAVTTNYFKDRFFKGHQLD